MRISNLLDQMPARPLPQVPADSHIDQVIEVMAGLPHARLVYVVDDEGRLLGAISQGCLLRHLFPHHYEGKIHPMGMLRRITAETARHLMEKHTVHTNVQESVDDVLKYMARTGVKELAVLDDEGRIVADVTVTDLLKHFHLDENRR